MLAYPGVCMKLPLSDWLKISRLRARWRNIFKIKIYEYTPGFETKNRTCVNLVVKPFEANGI